MFELFTARSDPIADASLPAILARNRPGTAIAAMIPMMATTISSSISVKPLVSRIFMSLLLDGLAVDLCLDGDSAVKCSPASEQPSYQDDRHTNIFYILLINNVLSD